MKTYYFSIIAAVVLTLYFSSCGSQLMIDDVVTAQNLSYDTEVHFLLSGSIANVGRFYTTTGTHRAEDFVCAVQHYQYFTNTWANNYEGFDKAKDDWGDESGNNFYGLIHSINGGIEIAAKKDKPAYGAVFQILKALVFQYITDRYGDIPYSEAAKGRQGFIRPVYDKQSDIYTDLLKCLDDAIAVLEGSATIDQSRYDLMYGGDKDKWIRFANSLKLRMLMRSYEAFAKMSVDNGAKISAIVQSGKFMRDNTESACFAFTGVTGFNSWMVGPNNESDNNQFTNRKPSRTLVETLKKHNDPRLKAWIAPAVEPVYDTPGESFSVDDLYGHSYTVTPVATSSIDPSVLRDNPVNSYYVGCPVGQLTGHSTIYGNTNTVGGNQRISSFTQVFRLYNAHDALKVVMMHADEVQFLLAEAAQRGIISGSAETYYKKGIELSCQRWLVPDASIQTYLSETSIQLGDDNLDKIATQKWLALFTTSAEAFFDYRRTRLPAVLEESASAIHAPFPVRFRYPVVETSNNKENCAAAAALMGGDTQSEKMWLVK